MKRYNKSEIMKHAWRLFRAGLKTWSEALRKAWYWAKDALEMSDMFGSLHIPCGEAAKPRTEQEKYMGYINGRMGYFKKHGHL